MKKMFKTATVLAALLAMTNFIACSSGDDDNNEPSSGTGTESSTTGDDSGSSSTGGDSSTTTTATSKTYNFVGLAFSDFPANSLTQKSDGTTVLAELGSETQPYIAVNGAGWSVADATVIVNNTKKVSARFTDSKTTALNIGNSNMTSATALDTTYNGIKITAPAAGTVTVTYKITAATSDTKTGAADTTFAVFQNNTVVSSKTYDTTYATYNALSSEQKTANYSNQTVSAAVAAGEVYIGYFRGSDATTGNADVMSIAYEPAAAE